MRRSKFCKNLKVCTLLFFLGCAQTLIFGLEIYPIWSYALLVPVLHFLVTVPTRAFFFFFFWSYISGYFFCGYEGLMYANLNVFQVSTPEAIYKHLFYSMVFTLPMALFVSLWYELKSYCKLNQISSLISLPLFIYLSEVFIPYLYPTFISVPLALSNSEFKHLFSIFGVEGLNLIIYWFAAMILVIFYLSKKFQKIAIFSTLSLLVFLITVYFTARIEKNNWNQFDEQVTIAYIQPNWVAGVRQPAEGKFEDEKKFLNEFPKIAQRLLNEHKKIDFIILPETHLFSDINTDGGNSMLIRRSVASLGTPVIAGGHIRNYFDNTNYNALYVLDENGQLTERYFKVELLPIGEYIPFSTSVPWLSKYMPGKNLYKFGPSLKQSVKEIKGIRFAFSICYEDMLRKLHKNAVNDSADIFLSVSSDAQFGKNFMARNHAGLVIARALEERLPVIRSTSTGLSFAMESSGKIIDKSPENKSHEGVFTLKYQRNRPMTIFRRIEFTLPALFSMLSLVAIMAAQRLENIKTA